MNPEHFKNPCDETFAVDYNGTENVLTAAGKLGVDHVVEDFGSSYTTSRCSLPETTNTVSMLLSGRRSPILSLAATDGGSV